MKIILLYGRTARHLALGQIAFRLLKIAKWGALYRHVPRGLAAIYHTNQVAAELSPGLNSEGEPIKNLEPRKKHMELSRRMLAEIRRGRFTFLNNSKTFPVGQIAWTCDDCDKLWLYHLNSFDYLIDLGLVYRENGDRSAFKTAKTLIEHWIRANPPGTAISWDPYVLSIRVRNWMRFFFLFRDSPWGDIRFWDQFVSSLYSQIRFLRHNIERDLTANHLLENGLSLLLGGLFFNGRREARRWERLGARLLRRELETQLLEDGGHFERSPMYHCILLEHLLECMSLITMDTDAYPLIRRACERMVVFLKEVRCRDGRIPLFGDSAFGVACEPHLILQYAYGLLGGGVDPWLERGRKKPLVQALEASGFYRISSGEIEMTINGGSIVSRRQPGHAHCDIFSYELLSGERRLIVDTGVCTYYGDRELRQYARSTHAHNTFVVDGREQHEIWDRFRVGRRAKVMYANLGTMDGDPCFRGMHDGYAHAKGHPVHTRLIRLLRGASFLVVDRLSGAGRHHVESFIHVHPDVSVNPETYNLLYEGTSLRVVPLEGVHVDVLDGWYCPEFNMRLENVVLRLWVKGEVPATLAYLLIPGDGAEASLQVSPRSSGVEIVLLARVGGKTYPITVHDALEPLDPWREAA